MKKFNQKFLDEIILYAKENFVPILRPESSKILCNHILKKQPKKILEIGTAIGYSGVLILKSAPNDAFLLTLEKDEKRLYFAKQNFAKFGFANKVEMVLCDANDFVKNSLQNKMFDFIFLDGPKSHYIKQLPYLLEHLQVGGILMADNVLFMGQVDNGEYPTHKHRTAILRLREFLEEIKNNSNLKSEIIEIEDGILIAEKIK